MLKFLLLFLLLPSVAFAANTVGFIQKMSTSTVQTDSAIYESTAGNIGIGERFPLAKMQVTTSNTLTKDTAYFVNSGALTTDNVILVVKGETINTGSASQSTGHSVGVWGHGTDTAVGRTSMIDTEGKVTAYGGIDSVVPYYALAGFARWYGSGTPNASSFISGMYIKLENAASEGGAVKNNIDMYGAYVDAGSSIGGKNVIGFSIGPVTSGSGLNVGLMIGNATNNTLWLSSNDNTILPRGGIVFGSSRDTNLYRSASGTLKTDGNFYTGGGIVALGGIITTGGAVNKATCFKGDGVSIGYCSSVVAADGSCTCN